MNRLLASVYGLSVAMAGLLGAAQAADAPSKGAYLATASDCVVCHSMSGGEPYAGGLRLGTPVGAIFSTNITPDPETGIGRYSFEDFDKAVRGGVAKDGRRLYPAMPYPNYARLTDEDLRALYDYFMKEVKPVRQANAPSAIPFPWDARWALGVWNVLMVDLAKFTPRPEYDAEWNRGAYLVQGPGHCGACHTPRGVAFQEKALDERSGPFLAGATLDNWSAANLTGDVNTGLGRWTEADIVDLLRSGQNRHAHVYGTMVEVVNYSTQFMTDADLKAIAKYLKSLPATGDRSQPVWVYNNQTAEDLRKGKLDKPGAATFLRQCASCHGVDGRGVGGNPPLAGNGSVMDADPVSLINVTLNGASRAEIEGAAATPRMPRFRAALNDQEIADVLTFVRGGFGNRAAPVTAAQIAPLRATTGLSADTVILRMR